MFPYLIYVMIWKIIMPLMLTLDVMGSTMQKVTVEIQGKLIGTDGWLSWCIMYALCTDYYCCGLFAVYMLQAYTNHQALRVYVCNIYKALQCGPKSKPTRFRHNFFIKYWPIFKLLSLTYSAINLQAVIEEATTHQMRCYTSLWNSDTFDAFNLFNDPCIRVYQWKNLENVQYLIKLWNLVDCFFMNHSVYASIVIRCFLHLVLVFW